jgi:excisionase family DNA binding protein
MTTTQATHGLGSVHEAADQLGVSRWTVQRLHDAGRLRGPAVGKRRNIEQASVDEVLAERRRYEDPDGPLADVHAQQEVHRRG